MVKINFGELVAHYVRASVTDLCRAEHHRFKSRSTRYFLSVPFTLSCMSSLSFILSISHSHETLAMKGQSMKIG